MTWARIVEDDEATLETVRDLLVDAECDVVTANSGLVGHVPLTTRVERLAACWHGCLDCAVPNCAEIASRQRTYNGAQSRLWGLAAVPRGDEPRAPARLRAPAAAQELDVPNILKPVDIGELVKAMWEAEQRLVSVAEPSGEQRPQDE